MRHPFERLEGWRKTAPAASRLAAADHVIVK
jgi:hypothetical protein